MARETRIATYCLFCRLLWAEVGVGLCPKEWELLGPKCAHKDNTLCEKDETNSCCACNDKRKQFLDLDLRVKDYCACCRRFWEIKQPSEWPKVWAKPPVQPAQPKPVSSRKPAPQPKPKPGTRKQQKDQSKEIELLVISEKSAAKGPEVETCEANEENTQLEDKGPQYGAPQFFDEKNPNPREADSKHRGEILQTIKVTRVAAPAEPWEIADSGPSYVPTPNFLVPADHPSATGSTTGMASQPTSVPTSSPVSPRSASAGSSRSSSKCHIE
jgi:hypothetical protein